MTFEHEEDLSLAEAARRAQVSEPTLRKYLKPTAEFPKGRLPNARKITRELEGGKTSEIWAIPFSDLYNAGLMKGSLKPKPAVKPEETPAQNLENVEVLKAIIEGLKQEIARLEETLARADRERERMSVYELAFQRQLETRETQATRKRFWQR
jgi:lambda repressor-like predicted transcriptional regulator